ncbi:hypothetical protein FACS1894211_03630 [Clostridia bacterium]|nr:hypothetical protein FACS1894211_03630 [Clostridia bacterium]
MNRILEKLKNKQNDIFGKPPVTVAFLGDSVTHGCFEIYKTGKNGLETVFDYENSYPKKFEKIIKTLYGKAQINIINAGASGGTAEDGLSRLDRDALRFSPDLVVVCFALNDSGRGGEYIETYTKSLKTIFCKVIKSGALCIFLTPNMMNTYTPYNDDPFFTNLADGIAEIQNGGMLKKYVEAAKAVAFENGVTVCDCYKKWETMLAAGVDTTALLANNVNHPKRDMNWLFAYSLAETLFSMEG